MELREMKRRAETPKRPFFRAIVLIAALGLTPGTQATARNAPSPETRSPSPTVTPREAELLDEVEALRTRDPDGALSLLARHIRPESSPALDFALGNLHFAADRLDEATEAYRRARERHPGFHLAAVNLSRVHLMREEPEEAARILLERLTEGGADADVYLLLGHALLLQGRPVSAETAFRQCLLRRPDERNALTGLARALLDQDRAVEAAALLRELTVRDPGDTEGWRLRAGASLNLGKTDRALVEIETARRLQQASAELLLRLGDLYLERGQAEEALGAYTEVLSGAPAEPEAAVLHAARALVHHGEADRALAMLRRLEGRSLAPAQERLRQEARAEAARMLGQTEVARAAWQARLQDDPGYGPALLALGDLEREAGAWEDAAIWYERAARIPGFEAQALVRRARVEIERARYGRAVEFLEASLVHERPAAVARYLEQIRRLAELHEP